MSGEWLAMGRAVKANNWADLQQGEVLVRAWRIDRVCAGGGCRLYFTRQTAYAPLSAPLTWSNRHWVASFDQTVPCTSVPQSLTDERSSWTLTVTRSGIQAVEHATSSANSSCAPASAVWDWTATPMHSVHGDDYT